MRMSGGGLFMRFNCIDEAYNVYLDEADPQKLGRMRAAAKRFMRLHPEVQANLKALTQIDNSPRVPYHKIL